MGEARGGAGFEDRLRAIGWLLDQRKQRLISLTLMTERTAMQVATAAGEPEEVTLSPSELVVLRCAARMRRGPSDAAAPQEGYQGTLRALGRMIDEREARACQVREQGDGFAVQLLDGEDEADWRTLQLDSVFA
jgi:hypothetical protein